MIDFLSRNSKVVQKFIKLTRKVYKVDENSAIYVYITYSSVFFLNSYDHRI